MPEAPAILRDAPEIVVVLGGGAPAGIPTASTVRRAEKAAELARQRPRAALILSGERAGWDTARTVRSEAELMAEVIVAAGIPRERLFLEDESRDTLGNAVLVAVRYLQGLEPRPVAVVTSPFHLDRSLVIFRAVLGPRWPVRGIASVPTDGDDERTRTEPGFLADNLESLSGIAPGDIAAFAAKLRVRWPYYERVRRLDPA
jgi:uncharacterized SAM-binding protein YcdF (DUF218 family)